MLQRFLITGVTGVGKSTICKSLRNIGYSATDIEIIRGMFKIYRISTKKLFKGFDKTNPEHIHDADWLCDVKKLKTFLRSQKSDIAFYGGIASNMDEIFPLFDKVFVLQPDKKTLNERLKKDREGTNRLGNVQAGRDVILGWKDWWEGEMRKKGAIFIDGKGSPQEVVERILDRLNLPSNGKINQNG